MRNLTIKRTKSFVGCLIKMKIYIEDPASNEITINNVKCRKIGDLKNGEEKTFQVDDRAAKIFVIADTLSKNYCNDYYQLPDGQDDVFLSGKNKFNPANGNAFIFDNNDNQEIAANRRRSTRKGLIVLIVCCIVGAVIGFGLTRYFKAPKAKTFSSNGMSITLTDEFRKTNIENYTVAYDSKNIAVFALKEEFTLAEGFGNNTLRQYAELVLKNNNLTSAAIKNYDGLVGFEYDFTNPQTHDTYRYFTYVYKSDDAFWMVQFATLSKNSEKYSSKITEWAQSVKFSK